MLTNTSFAFGFYGVSAVAVVWLLWRHFRKRRPAVRETADHMRRGGSQTHSAHAVAGPASSTAVAPASVAAVASRRQAAGSPRRAVLFTFKSAQRTAASRLPRIERDEVPHADAGDYLFGPITPVLAALLPESEPRRDVLKNELRQAGFYQPHALQNLSAARYLLLMVPLVFCGLLLVLVPRQFEGFVLALLIGLPVIGWALPRLFLKGRAAERKSEIERAMPDMLDMLNMCVSQGMTVLAGLRRVNRELCNVSPALHQELQIVIEQAELYTLEKALENFHARVDVPEVHSFTSLLIQTERMGTSVSRALAEHSDSMRESLRQRADQKGNRAAFRLLFPTVLCLMPAVYIFLLGPSIIELSDFFTRGSQVLDQATDTVNQVPQFRRGVADR